MFNLAVALQPLAQGGRLLQAGRAEPGRLPRPRRLRDGGRLRAAHGREPHIRERGNKEDGEPEEDGTLALKEASSITGAVNTFDLGFKLGPRINASGRMRTAGKAVELFISDDIRSARDIAKALSRENSKRQNIEGEILAEAVRQIESRSRDSEGQFDRARVARLASGNNRNRGLEDRGAIREARDSHRDRRERPGKGLRTGASRE